MRRSYTQTHVANRLLWREARSLAPFETTQSSTRWQAATEAPWRGTHDSLQRGSQSQGSRHNRPPPRLDRPANRQLRSCCGNPPRRMRSRDGTQSVGVVVAQVLVTCTNQSSRRALIIKHYARCGAHNIMLRTWSFVLKQRGLGHEGRERVRRNAFFLYATRFALCTAQCMRTSSARNGPERTVCFHEITRTKS